MPQPLLASHALAAPAYSRAFPGISQGCREKFVFADSVGLSRPLVSKQSVLGVLYKLLYKTSVEPVLHACLPAIETLQRLRFTVHATT